MRQRLNQVAGLMLLGGLGSYVYLMVTAEDHMREFCGSIKPGMKVAELQSLVSNEIGVSPVPQGSGVKAIGQSLTVGENACLVTIVDNVVTESVFSPGAPRDD